jgi:D-beta-D-heptose 7-phosphate kinase/D-beta-D-heptose 1-phosphate adenosyltransferase
LLVDRLSPDRLDALLERMRSVRVLVLGDLMLDVYLRGTASRLSPEAPVPVVRISDEWRALGGAANVASNVVSLGANCELAGCIGTDRAGEQLREELARLGIGSRGLLLVEGRPTTVKTRIMARQYQIARYDREVEDDLDAAAAAGLVATIEALLPDTDAIVLEDYNKGVLVPEVIRAAIDAGAKRGIPVVVDPKAKNFFAYGGATVFKPNLVELGAALRAPVLADDPAWLERVRAELGCSHLLVTLGEGGMALATAEGEYLRVPTSARSVFDVSGAGDTVTAVVATALGAGASIAEAAILANHAAGIEVGKVGVATVSPEELREAILQYQNR